MFYEKKNIQFVERKWFDDNVNDETSQYAKKKFRIEYLLYIVN